MGLDNFYKLPIRWKLIDYLESYFKHSCGGRAYNLHCGPKQGSDFIANSTNKSIHLYQANQSTIYLFTW